MVDIRKSPLPSLENLAEGVTVQLTTVLKHGAEPIKVLDVNLRESGTHQGWFPGNRHTVAHDLRLDTHLGAGGAMSTGRIQDPEGVCLVVLVTTLFKTRSA